MSLELSPNEISEAREWLRECINCEVYRDVDPDEADEVVAELTDAQVIAKIRREYAGGIQAFKAAIV